MPDVADRPFVTRAGAHDHDRLAARNFAKGRVQWE
jgi:hypothetical protein